MRIVATLALIFGVSGSALAQDTVPDLKGIWTTTFDFVIFGNNIHHPGGQTVTDPPRAGPIEFTLDVESQDGRKLWGKSWSDPARKEPFAWVISPSGKTIIGADVDGTHQLTVLSSDSMEMCYAHPGTSPTKSIVAACGILERKK